LEGSFSAIVLGQFPSFQIKEGRFNLTLALPGSSQASRVLIEPALRSILHEYLRILPDTPEFHVLLPYFRGPEENSEAYKDSGALTSVDPITPRNQMLWTNFLAHELFHHWNGNMIMGKDEGDSFGTSEWFTEGATEYVANRTLVRTGIIAPSLFLRKMEINIAMYLYWKWAAPCPSHFLLVPIFLTSSFVEKPLGRGTRVMLSRAGEDSCTRDESIPLCLPGLRLYGSRGFLGGKAG
jgi:hypothetical protein